MFHLKQNLMKKFLIMLAICSIALTANAQFFVGGKFGFDVHSNRYKEDKAKTADIETQFNLLIGPRFGYCINEKWAVGADVLIGPKFNIETYFENDDSKKKASRTSTTFKWGIYPFARYTFFTYKAFSFGVEGSIGVGGSHSSWKTKYKDHKEDNDKGKGPYTIHLQVFNIKPVMAVKLKEHLFLETSLDFLGFHYGMDITPYQKGKNGGVTTVHDFGLNITNLTQLTMGIVYKF